MRHQQGWIGPRATRAAPATTRLLPGRAALTAIPLRAHAAVLASILLWLLGPAVAQAAGEFERIREKAGELVVAVNRCQAETFADGRASKLEQTYGGFSYLLTPGKAAELDRMVSEAPDEATRAHYARSAGILHLHAVGARVAALQDAWADALRDRTVVVEDTALRLFDLDQRLALQPNRERRLAWWMAAGQLCQTMTVYRRNLLVDLDAHCRELGYAGYYPLLDHVEGWDHATMRAAAERLLDETAAAFTARLEALSQAELGLELRRVRTYDAEFLFSFPTLSARTGERDPVEIVRQTFLSAGIDLDRQRGLALRVGEKAGRMPRATAWPVRARWAVVAMVPTGRLSDLPDLLGAVGEGQFYFDVPGELPFEDAYVGTNVLPATLGALWAMIAEEPAWVAAQIGPELAAEVAAAMRLRRLYLARRAAGEYLFELALGEDPGKAPDRYIEIMERALIWPRIARDRDACLLACDGYRSGGRLLGFVLAAQIRDALVARWGPAWYAHEGFGAQVVAAAQHGYAVPLAEFLAQWGVSSLDAGVIARQLAEG